MRVRFQLRLGTGFEQSAGMKMKRTLILFSSCLVAVACDSKKTPITQDRNGNCNKAFLEAYNKVQGSNFELQQQDTKETKASVSDACENILKTYGTSSEACLATDLKTGESVYLSTANLQKDCADKMQTKVFASTPE
jgi:hypothetical protein